MSKKESIHSTNNILAYGLPVLIGVAVAVIAYAALPEFFAVSYSGSASSTLALVATKTTLPPVDIVDYNERLLALAHVATSSPWYEAFLSGATSTQVVTSSSTSRTIVPLWPKQQPYPNSAALLPFNRIVAYYGNFYSTGMGVLGQYPEAVVLQKLNAEVAHWEAADPTTPVIPAIEYIDVTAQGSPGKDGKYRLRMPDDQIDKAIEMAKKVNGIVILDVQVGLSTLQAELPLLSSYLAMPQVHLAIDPEFAMHNGAKPGSVIGSMDATDINYAANFLAKLVKDNNLPPKILVVHRFTEDMVTHYKNIKPLPEVQIVMQMDGWGFPAKKINTYNSVIWPEPVQFTGLKLFYKNDLSQTPSRLLTTKEVLNLTPSPIFIQYQ